MKRACVVLLVALLLASVVVYAADPLWNGRGRIVISSDGNAHDEDDWGLQR